MNTTRLLQGGLVAVWAIETACIGVAVSWILIAVALGLVMMMNDSVMSKHLLDQLITFDVARWHVGLAALSKRLTWVSMVLVVAYRLTLTQPAQEAADRLAIHVGRLVARRVLPSLSRFGFEPGTLGRMVFVLFANFTILIVYLLWLPVHNGAPRHEASASTMPVLACPYTVSPRHADTATFDHDTTFTNKGDAA
ncbi:hypothetical protein [Burkholderia gladioli]|uniref:hypothetical protein n=1 Tax=Burkholderia gladioli TaxID=28095 RepID=UPI003B97FE8A